ncbi:MAG: hydrolase [Actinomycetota bacterium]|nr:hydrolase [Actinomycetota bacterium]
MQTPVGPARVLVDGPPVDRRCAATLVLGHGAGRGADARDLAALAQALPESGIAVVRVEQPWRAAGRRVAAPPRTLDIAWRAVLEDLRAAGDVHGPVVSGGRSAGARVACRTASDTGAAGVVALAFPLEPPGRRGGRPRSRLDELVAVPVPLLVVRGERDAFGGAARLETVAQGRWPVAAVPAADHGFAVLKRSGASEQEALACVVDAVTSWLGTTVLPTAS